MPARNFRAMPVLTCAASYLPQDMFAYQVYYAGLRLSPVPAIRAKVNWQSDLGYQISGSLVSRVMG